VSGRFGSPTTRSGSLYWREGGLLQAWPLRSESQVHNTGEQVGLYVLLIPVASHWGIRATCHLGRQRSSLHRHEHQPGLHPRQAIADSTISPDGILALTTLIYG